MNAPPREINGAKVISFTPIDGRHWPTGKCMQIVAGILQGPAAGLAICQFDGEDCFYLFGCDADWKAVTDTWHQTIEDAKEQAGFAYSGAMGTWETHDEESATR